MIRAALISAAAGSRRIEANAFPLALGGERAEIACPGVAADTVLAFIGLSQGHAFVQPAGDGAALTVNGDALGDSAWLRDGDRIAAGGAEVRVTVRADVLALTVTASARPAALAAPPSAPPPDPGTAAPRPGAPVGAPGADRTADPPRPDPPRESPQRGPADRDGHASGTAPTAAAPRIELGRRRAPPRALSLALLGVFCVLVAAAAFVFLSTAATLRVEPAPDTLRLDGPFPHVEAGGRFLLLPGRYRLRATKAGHRDLDEAIEVQRGRHLDRSFRLEPLPGLLSVTTRPAAGVLVSVDGTPVGEAPLADLRLEAGAHTLRAEAERHLPAERVVQVEGLGRRQSVQIALEPRWARVSFTSEPDGAEVWIAGELRGVTPLALELLDGDHEGEIRKAGYRSATASFTVQPGVALELPPFRLAEALARLRVASVPPGASVTVDGDFAGRTPLDLDVTPREAHRVQLSRAGYRPATRTLTLTPGERHAVEVRLSALLGVVFVTVDPADAELVVDGEARGAATGRHELTATEHAIEIRRDGYRPHRATLTPRPDVSQRVDVTLEPVERAPPGALRTGEGQELVLIAPGTVRMGASRREPGRRANEPLRRAVLERPFYFARREVTNAEFRRFDPQHSSGSAGGVSLDADAAPVAGVTWQQAARYLNWLSRKDGLPPAYEARGEELVPVRPPTTGYRLPTEAEWAYVARRAGRSSEEKYPWGGAFPPAGRAGNYADRSARDVLSDVVTGYDDGHAASAPVASFDANPVGVYDLGGNVAEWCHDRYSPGGDPDGAVDPLGPEAGRHHVVRGSSWRHASISELRLSFRDYSDKARSDLGFRIARYAR